MTVPITIANDPEPEIFIPCEYCRGPAKEKTEEGLDICEDCAFDIAYEDHLDRIAEGKGF